ncbi:MAG: amidohydrolase [Synergistaceae bacterium]|jgi:amidohydrolase|nr:amidohydrolase [Synergistaceae bacterium]
MADFQKNEDDIRSYIKTHLAEYAALSDWMAENPELGGEEFKASAKMSDMLQKLGFDVEYPYLGIPTAFNAVRGKGAGPVAALLVEYDALPGIGHACGHNLHGAMSLLAGAALAEAADGFGEIRVTGTPAEETNGAKAPMAEAGAFDDADIAMMIHTEAGRTSAVYRSLAVRCLEFSFKGRPAHASGSPWEGLNALNGVQLLFHALDMQRQHVKDMQIHGIITNGGAAPNIVPEFASAKFYFRAPSKKCLELEMEKVYNCARGAALAAGVEVSWRTGEASSDDMLPNQAAEGEMKRILSGMGYAVNNRYITGGSSDMGNVSWRCPAIQPLLDVAAGQYISPHTHEFAKLVYGPQVREHLARGAEALAVMGLRVITDAALRNRIRADFDSAREKTEAL